MQTPQIPEAGKTYQSQTDPAFRLYVESVHTDDDPATFLVEGCNPSAKDDMGEMGYELTADEWNEHRFTPILCK